MNDSKSGMLYITLANFLLNHTSRILVLSQPGKLRMTQPICFGPFEKLNPRDDFSLRQSDHVKESVTDSLTIQGISRKATAGRERLSRTCCSWPRGVSSKVVTNEN